MNEKIQLTIESTENRIQWEQETINHYLSDIQKQAASAKSYDIVTFLPGKIEQLKEAMDRQKALREQLQILKFIQKEN